MPCALKSCSHNVQNYYSLKEIVPLEQVGEPGPPPLPEPNSRYATGLHYAFEPPLPIPKATTAQSEYIHRALDCLFRQVRSGDHHLHHPCRWRLHLNPGKGPPYLYPLEAGWPSYTPRHWVLIFIAFYDSHELRWDYSFPRSHTGTNMNPVSINFVYVKRQRNSRSLDSHHDVLLICLSK